MYKFGFQVCEKHVPKYGLKTLFSEYMIISVLPDVRHGWLFERTSCTCYCNAPVPYTCTCILLWPILHFLLFIFSIQLDIDDKETISESYEGRRRMATTSYLYFGGMPFRPADANVGTSANFIGCVGDVTINGKWVAAKDQLSCDDVWWTCGRNHLQTSISILFIKISMYCCY